jgi:ABC-type transporter Mla subunit MlaD
MNIVRQEIRTGLLVVFTIGVLVTMMLYLGAPGVFIPQKAFTIYLENANGVKIGADVALAGRKIGQVVNLYSPVPEAERAKLKGRSKKEKEPRLEVKVDIKVNRSALIYKDVRVALTSTGLLGEYFIDFAQGEESSGLAPEHFVFIGERPAGLEKAVPMVLEAIEPVLKGANDTMNSLQRTSDNLARLTSEGGEVERTVAEFRKFASNLQDLSSRTGPLRLALDNVATLTGPDGRIQLALGNIENMTKPGSSLDQTLKNAQTFTANLAANKDLDATLKNAKQATAQLNGTLNDLRGKFSTIADNLQDATDTVKRQPWRLVWPSTKKYGDEEPANKARPASAPKPRAGKRERSR